MPGPEMRYLLNTKTGVIMPWSPLLARLPHLVPCDENGADTTHAPDDPYLRQETQNHAAQFVAAMLATRGPLMMEGMDDFRRQALRVAWDKGGKDDTVIWKDDRTPFQKRLDALIDKRVRRAKAEIMSLGSQARGLISQLAYVRPRIEIDRLYR